MNTDQWHCNDHGPFVKNGASAGCPNCGQSLPPLGGPQAPTLLENVLKKACNLVYDWDLRSEAIGKMDPEFAKQVEALEEACIDALPPHTPEASTKAPREWWLVKWPSGSMEVRMERPTSGHAAFSTEAIHVREVVEAPEKAREA